MIKVDFEQDLTSAPGTQVLGELFNAIHRALLGSAAEKAADPQLPVKIRLNAQGDENKAVPNGMSNPKDAATPQSLVQRLFGLQVRVRICLELHVLITL